MCAVYYTERRNDSHGLSSFDVFLEEITSYCKTNNTLIPNVDFVLRFEVSRIKTHVWRMSKWLKGERRIVI